MKINLRRAAVAAAVPVLMLSVAACGEDEGSASESSSESTESTESSESTESDEATEEPSETESAETAPSDGAEAPSAPSAGDIPDPTEDPDAFRDYLVGMYEDAGMPKEQATCMADAFMENVDIEAIASDPSKISSMMNDPKLMDAMKACV